ncbi:MULTISPECIES: hypothetical protein [unclassified Streptomyces]|uniref:hypothetical protein n=1 Tax=unclassified Streptomyces TaxID=2593676 RepID=UPI0009389183|nr:hypothetical protein [Streptomyces sp. TSRI0107]OKJ88677.1 hypothetical protein AMK31_09470 [Streptomyces sp. TSRI0107]
MEEIPPFEYDDEDALSAGQRLFADVLAARARSWPVDPLGAVLLPPPRTPYGRLLAYLDIDDPELRRGVLTVGAHFDGAAVRGDRLHNQDFTLPGTPTELAFAADRVGPAEAASRTADWFESVLARPPARCEWLHDGRTYAVRYEYADTGRGLSEGFVGRLAPPGPRSRLAADGVDGGRGRINRAGLGEPDRVTVVRGDPAAVR